MDQLAQAACDQLKTAFAGWVKRSKNIKIRKYFRLSGVALDTAVTTCQTGMEAYPDYSCDCQPAASAGSDESSQGSAMSQVKRPI